MRRTLQFNVQKDKEVRQLLQGDYAIHGLNGATLYAQVNPPDLIIIPEGQGTFWAEALTPDGRLYERYARGNTAVVDVGYYTTDVVLLQDYNKGFLSPDALPGVIAKAELLQATIGWAMEDFGGAVSVRVEAGVNV